MKKKIIAVLAFFVFANFNFAITPSADNAVEISAVKKVEAKDPDKRRPDFERRNEPTKEPAKLSSKSEKRKEQIQNQIKELRDAKKVLNREKRQSSDPEHRKALDREIQKADKRIKQLEKEQRELD